MALFGFGKSEPTPTPAVEATPAVKATPQNTPAAEEPKEGLDKFSYLFDNKEGDKGEKEEEEQFFDPMAALQDDQAMSALLSKVDFKNSISDATRQKLADNDPNAMLDVMNDIAKEAYKTALVHNQTMTSRYVQDQSRVMGRDVSSKISQSLSDKDLENALPEISNPVVALGVKPFISELRKHNPRMSSAELVAEVKGYLQELNIKINPNSPYNPKKPKEDEGIDWLEELGL